MAGSSLLTLLDDIATLLDDIAVLSKVALKKTSGVLGDDLALNAEQVSGIRAERELPVVWAVAKGSFLNKLFLVPAALAISAFIPWLITPLLMLGGAYLCYEGFEKVAHKFIHSPSEGAALHESRNKAIADSKIDMVQFEKDKIKGAIRTDFILSAEIIVIALGTVKEASFQNQVMVVSTIAILITILVYGLVAGIVKLDDVGFHLIKKQGSNLWRKFQRSLGRGFLSFAPVLMKSLTVIGTIAMFLVGGGILVHGTPILHHLIEQSVAGINLYPSIDFLLASFASALLNMLIGVLAGLVIFALIFGYTKIKANAFS